MLLLDLRGRELDEEALHVVLLQSLSERRELARKMPQQPRGRIKLQLIWRQVYDVDQKLDLVWLDEATLNGRYSPSHAR